MKKLMFILLFVFFSMSHNLYSYPNNFQQIMTGSRIAAMGGAACALGGGGETAFFNPAGTVFTKKDGISLSINHYGFIYLFESERDKAGDSLIKDLDHSSGLAIIPAVSTVTIILDKNKARPQFFFTFGIFLPSKTDIEGNKNKSNSSYDEYVKSWLINYIYHIYLNFAYRVNDNISIGIAVVGSYAKLFQTVELYRYDIATPANTTDISESYNFLTLGLGLSLGALFTVGDFRFGINIKTKKLRIYSESEYTYIDSGQSPVDFDDKIVNYQRPWEFYFGVVYEFIKNRFLISVDFKLYVGETQNVIDSSDFSLTFKRNTTWNINAGFEYKFDQKWSVRAGFFTDNSATPSLESGNSNALRLTKVNRYGITLGGGFVGKNTKLDIAVTYIWGHGQMKIQNISSPGNYGVSDVKSREILITVGSAYWFGSDNKSKTNVKKNRRK